MNNQKYTVQKKPIPFRYPGGKFYALNRLAPYWLMCPHVEYREPFVGGGSVFFTKPKAKYNVLNDIDSELIATYKVMQDRDMRSLLVELVSREMATPERWKEMRDFVPGNELETAYKYYYMNRTSFSGKLASPAWGYREKRSLPPERWQERILPCGELLEGTDIFNDDFENIIRMPAKKNEGDVLMFIDPPYFKPQKHKHYRNGFDMEDHERLAVCLRETGFKFFLTYEDTPEIREMYSWANIFGLEFTYRIDNSVDQNGSRKKGAEIVVANYDPFIVEEKLF